MQFKHVTLCLGKFTLYIQYIHTKTSSNTLLVKQHVLACGIHQGPFSDMDRNNVEEVELQQLVD